MSFVSVVTFVFVSMQVIAESLSEEEIAGLREMFETIDSDNSGYITFEELKVGLTRYGANLEESEIHRLLRAVSTETTLGKLEAQSSKH